MPPYLETARAFDGVAGDYDAAYGPDGNAVMTWMRRESLAVLEATFPVGSRLLELGCGTGEEAVHLARAGRTVLATDVSPRMAAITAAKARDAGVDLQGVALPASGIAALHPGTPFDGVYASFGGLNCEPDLGAVARGLERLVRPGGAFVTSVMSRYCLFEVVWYLAHGRPGRAFRRWRRGWQAAPVA
ncbi:MAG: class I SAM-dependent methyltransferase, partial [Anaerolineae bacterium]|nr:class I SAM-dependent methyltransferase [Anaerolineae bacterium]